MRKIERIGFLYLKLKHVPLFLVGMLACLSMLASILELKAVVYRSASTSLISGLSSQTINGQDKIVDTLLTQNHGLLSGAVDGGYQYELLAIIASWKAYSERNFKEAERAQTLFLQSIQSRPTWSSAYLGLLRVNSSHPNIEFDAFDPLLLANRFGPYMTDTMFANYNDGFSRWETLNGTERITLTRHFLNHGMIFANREHLEQLLRYSPGAARICRLLQFNEIEHTSCLKQDLPSRL